MNSEKWEGKAAETREERIVKLIFTSLSYQLLVAIRILVLSRRYVSSIAKCRT
jgi:hypothetical protein